MDYIDYDDEEDDIEEVDDVYDVFSTKDTFLNSDTPEIEYAYFDSDEFDKQFPVVVLTCVNMSGEESSIAYDLEGISSLISSLKEIKIILEDMSTNDA